MATPPDERNPALSSTDNNSKPKDGQPRRSAQAASIKVGEPSKAGAGANFQSPIEADGPSNLMTPAEPDKRFGLGTAVETAESSNYSIPVYPTFTGKGKERATDDEVAAQEYYSAGDGPVRAYGDAETQGSDNGKALIEDHDPLETSESSNSNTPVKPTISAMNNEPVREPEGIDIEDLSLEEEPAKDNDTAETIEGEDKGKEREPEPEQPPAPAAAPEPKPEPKEPATENDRPTPKQDAPASLTSQASSKRGKRSSIFGKMGESLTRGVRKFSGKKEKHE